MNLYVWASLTFWTVEVSSRQSWMILLLVEVKSLALVRGVLQRGKIQMQSQCDDLEQNHEPPLLLSVAWRLGTKKPDSRHSKSTIITSHSNHMATFVSVKPLAVFLPVCVFLTRQLPDLCWRQRSSKHETTEYFHFSDSFVATKLDMCAVWDCFSKPLDIRLDLVLKKKQNKKTFTNIFDDARDHCWTQRFNETRRHFPAGLWQQNWIFLMRRLQMRDHCWRLHFNIYWCETTKCFSRRHWDTFSSRF